MKLSIYDRMGGSAAVHALVEAVYLRLLADPEMARFFDGVEMDDMKRRQRIFMCQAFGGPIVSELPDLAQVHAHLVSDHGLCDGHYDRFIECVRLALADLNIPEGLSLEVVSRMEAFRGLILGNAEHRKAA